MNEKLPPRREQLPDEPDDTQTVEDFAREVDALEKRFHTPQDSLVSGEEQKNIPPSEYVFDYAEQRRVADAIEERLLENAEKELDMQHEKIQRDTSTSPRQSAQGELKSGDVPNSPIISKIEPIEESKEPAEKPAAPDLIDESLADTIDIDRRHFNLQKKLATRNKQANQGYQKDIAAQLPNIPTATVPDVTPSPEPESEIEAVIAMPETPLPEIMAEPAPLPSTPEITPLPTSPEEAIPIRHLSKDVADTFEKHFSLDTQTLRDTPGFQNLNDAQQRLVLERFSSLVRENIHAGAVQEHLATIDSIKRTPAPTRFGRLKRAVHSGWQTTTRSYQIGKQEAELHEAWTSAVGGKETEKLRLLTELSQSILEDNAFGVDGKGRVNFSEGEGALTAASERLNTLMRTKPEIGEKGAHERLTALNEAIELGIGDIRSSFPDTMTPLQEQTFEHAAADWALRARKEVVLGTFMEKHRDLENTLQNNEAARGFARTTLAERGGLALAGFAGRGVLGTMCGFLAAPLVGAGIGGFMGWRRKGIEQSDADLLARMGEKVPSPETPKKESVMSPAHLTLLRKGVAERLAVAKTKKNNDAEIRVLSRRLVGYDTQLRSHESPQPAATETPEGSFGFDNGKILNEKLLRLSREYAQAVEDLRFLSVPGSDLDVLEAQRIKTEKLADRLAARTDYTQKRIMQQRVDIGGSPSARAGMLANLAAALGTAETTLSMNDRAQQTKLQAHLHDVSAVLAGRDKNVDKARLREKKQAALQGAAIGAGFAFAGAALRDIFSSDSAIAAKYAEVFPAAEKDTAGMDALMQKLSAQEAPVMPAKPIITETVVGGSGGFQITPQEWHREPVPPVRPNEFTNRMHAMEEALRQKPVHRPTYYDQPRFRADYHSPRTPRHFPDAWARGTASLDGGGRSNGHSFFEAPRASNPITLESLATIPHETPVDAQRVMNFYQNVTEGKSAAFAQHIREQYTLKARLALKYPELTADIARMHPPVDDATMQSLVKMTKGAYLNGKSNPFMYAHDGITEAPKYPYAEARLASELDRMRVNFHRDANGRIVGYDTNTRR